MNDMTPIDIAHPQDGMRDLATRIEAEHAALNALRARFRSLDD